MAIVPPPGRELLQQVRAGFVAQGTSYSRWCSERGILRSSASQALLGAWNGPKAQRLRAEIVRASGLQSEAA